MKQQVTAAMMTMPTNKAEDTPITRGMRSRSATGEGTQRGMLKACGELCFYQLIFQLSNIQEQLKKPQCFASRPAVSYPNNSC